MAAHARAFGYCFNPISVFWCLDGSGRQVATVVEVHNTYGDRHAYLVHPDERGRARVPKAMYVSPFHGTDGTYDLAVPLPGDRLHIAVTLRSDDGAVFSASLTGTRAPGRLPPAGLRRAAPRRAARVHAHPRPRHPPVAPTTAGATPAAPSPGRREMTLAPARRSAPGPTSDRPRRTYWPGLDLVPSGRARPSRPRWPHACSAAVEPAPRHVVVERPEGLETLGLGGPTATIRRPDEFFTRIGVDGLIGFGEAYLTGAWDTEDPTDRPVPDRARGRRPPADPRQPAEAAGIVVAVHRGCTATAPRNTRGNIAHHYDLSNELFESFLDPTLSYSSALFESVLVDRGTTCRRRRRSTPAARGARGGPARKIDRLLDEAHVRPGTRVLEIGTGWGELAIRAAAGAPTCTRSRCPASRRRWPTPASLRPASPTGSRSSSATTAT